MWTLCKYHKRGKHLIVLCPVPRFTKKFSRSRSSELGQSVTLFLVVLESEGHVKPIDKNGVNQSLSLTAYQTYTRHFSNMYHSSNPQGITAYFDTLSQDPFRTSAGSPHARCYRHYVIWGLEFPNSNAPQRGDPHLLAACLSYLTSRLPLMNHPTIF
jgi:hypothetical protein